MIILFGKRFHHLFNSSHFKQFSTMSKIVRVGVIQLTSTNDKEHNFQKCSKYINESIQHDAKMIFLPEGFDFISDNKNEALQLSESLDGNLMEKYRDMAKKYKIFLSLGGFHRKDESISNGKLFNSHVVIGANGEIVSVYDKLHLFDVDIPGAITLQESKVTQFGQSIVKPAITPLGLVGLSICYDLRFQCLAQCYREMNASVLTYPSAFTVKTGEAHWHTLLKSRAIENQCFVIAAAQEGQHNAKRKSYGHSLVVDPWGTIIAEKTDPGPGLLLCDIDLSLIEKYRSEMPVFFHRRLDLFPSPALQGICREIGDASFSFGPNVIHPSCVFYRSALSFAFVNISPLVPGHVLVSSIRVIDRFIELSEMEVLDIYSVVRKVAPELAKHFNAEGLTISQQDGAAAGQSVQHVHVHILPRKLGDFLHNDDIYKALQSHDKPENIQRKFRTVDEMAEEATEFRKLFYS